MWKSLMFKGIFFLSLLSKMLNDHCPQFLRHLQFSTGLSLHFSVALVRA